MKKLFSFTVLAGLTFVGWGAACWGETEEGSEALVNSAFSTDGGAYVSPAFSGESSAPVVTPAYAGTTTKKTGGGAGGSGGSAPGAVGRSRLFIAQGAATPAPAP